GRSLRRGPEADGGRILHGVRAPRRGPARTAGGLPMNKMTFGALSAVAQVERPTQRALAKQRTREKILASARTLFTERGYDGATVRDIASAAGMSTGAVFASFTDKSDLFIEIVGDQHDALVRAMRAAAACKKPRAAVEAVLDA